MSWHTAPFTPLPRPLPISITQLAVLHQHVCHVARLEAALKEEFADGIGDVAFDRAPELPRAEFPAVALLGEKFIGALVHPDAEPLLVQAQAEPVDHTFQNRPDILEKQRIKGHNFVNPINEFGPKVLPELIDHLRPFLAFS